MALASSLRACFAAALFALVAFTLNGCQRLVVDRTHAVRFNGTMTDLSDVITNLHVSLAEFTDDATATTLRGVNLWNFHVPMLEVQPSREIQLKMHAFTMRAFDFYADFSIDYLKAIAEGQEWEIENIHGSFSGEFRTVMSLDFRPPYAVDFANCSASPVVKILKLHRKTWHTADFFGLVALVTRKVKLVLEDATETMFQKVVCSAYKFTEGFEAMVDDVVATDISQLGFHGERHPIANPYRWSDSRIVQWMEKFNDNARANEFSIKKSLEPFFDGLGTSRGWCALGPKADGCYIEMPGAVSNNLNHSWGMTDGHTVDLQIENLSITVVDFAISEVVIPKLSDLDGEAIGFDFMVSPLHVKLSGDLNIMSDAYNSTCDVKHGFAVDVHVKALGASGSFIVQVDADRYQALTPLQKATLACADAITTDFRLERVAPTVRLEKIDVFISHGSDKKASTRLVEGIQKLVDELIVSGINNAEDKIQAFFSVEILKFVALNVNMTDGLRGLMGSLGQDIGTCPSASSAMPATIWAWIAGITLSLAVAVCVLCELQSRCGKKSGRPPPSSCYCLASAPLTPGRWRTSVPIFVVGCIFLYIQSNTGEAAVMTAYLTSPEFRDVEMYRLTSFGVVKSIFDLWNAEMKELAVLLFSFSVVFPYLKLTLCLTTWFVPLPPYLRGKVLHVLNAMGKWSLLDAYVLMTLMGLGSLDTHMKGKIGLSVFIDPRPAFVSFLVATIISLVLGEVILGCHETNLEQPAPANRSGSAPNLIVHLLIFALVLLAVASCLDVCTFEVQGIVGWFLNYLHGDSGGNQFKFSLLSLGVKLSNVTSDAHQMVAFFMQVIYFMSTLVMNIAFILAAIVFAKVPLRRGAAEWAQMLLPVIFLWGAADVYAIGTILTIIETRHGSFVPTPGWLREEIQQTIRPRIMMPGASNEIIQIIPRVEVGAWFIFIGALIYGLAGCHLLRHIEGGEDEGGDKLTDDGGTSASESE